MGELLERLYMRLGPRYVRPFVVAGFLLGSVLAIVGAWVLSLYVDLSFSQFVAFAGFALLVTAIGLAWSAIGGLARYWVPIRDWIEHGRGPDGADAAWSAAMNYPVDTAIYSYPRCFLASAVPVVVYAAVGFDLTAGEIGVLTAAIVAGSAYPTLILVGALQYYVRPIIRDALVELPLERQRPHIRLPLRLKLMGTLPLIAGLTGLFVAILKSGADPQVSELGLDIAISFAVAASLSLLVVAIIAESVLSPVDSLTAATRRVRSGDLSTVIPVNSGDELGVLASSFNEMSAELQRSREHLLAAQEQERRRIRRDLHDGLGPVLGGIGLQLDAATNLLDDPERARTHLAQSRDDIKSAIADVRRLVHDLRPPSLDRLGLVGAIRQRAERLEGDVSPAGTNTTFTVDADPDPQFNDLAPDLEVAALRIAGEAMTNVVRHSKAQHCTVRLAGGSTLEISVEDDGVGVADDHIPGIGLASMRDRAEKLGGDLELCTRPGGGTVLTARLPVVTE